MTARLKKLAPINACPTSVSNKLPQRLLALRKWGYGWTACIFPLPRKEWQMDMLSIAIVALVAIAVVVGFFFVMRPEQNQ